MIPWVLQLLRTQMTPTSLAILSNTNTKDHLFMSWQYYPPIRVPLTKTVRGITLVCGYVYHWNNPHIAEQTAWGNTIDHDFYIGNLTPRATIWLYLWAPGGPYGKQIQGPLLVITLPPTPFEDLYKETEPGTYHTYLYPADHLRTYHARAFSPTTAGTVSTVTVTLRTLDPHHPFKVHMQLRAGPETQPNDDILETSITTIYAIKEGDHDYTFWFTQKTPVLVGTRYWIVIYRADEGTLDTRFTCKYLSDPYGCYDPTGLQPWELYLNNIDILVQGEPIPGPRPYDLAIGKPAIDRIGGFIATYTIINQAPLTTDEGDPPPSGGTIDKVSIWATETLTFVRVGTFSRDGDKFTCRDSAFIGTVPWGSEQSFDDLGLIVEVGDHLGIYFTSGELDVGPDPTCYIYYKAGDQFEEGEQHYDAFPDYAASLHGEGWTFP